MQIASNYANDYADGIRGTDVNRIGPTRLVASGKARPSAVKRAAVIASAVGAAFGLALVALSGMWWLLAVGAVAIAAAWGYTASKRPYGYRGWGEVAVFVFFGPIAVLGTMLTQAGTVTWWSVFAATGVGLYAVTLLMVNNLRDRATDLVAGKRTLAVLLGDGRTRVGFAAAVLLPIACAVAVAFALPWALMATVVALPSALAAAAVVGGASGIALKPVFQGLGGIGLAYSALLALGILVS